ncbi:hypothetical protein BDV93DRAFT_513199 [Ceratobasidium sp. AG-I]|nr:hypothetical protein BDV93DRAFT_513199 [Ceratobasidium sp. AG-I]
MSKKYLANLHTSISALGKERIAPQPKHIYLGLRSDLRHIKSRSTQVRIWIRSTRLHGVHLANNTIWLIRVNDIGGRDSPKMHQLFEPFGCQPPQSHTGRKPLGESMENLYDILCGHIEGDRRADHPQ